MILGKVKKVHTIKLNEVLFFSSFPGKKNQQYPGPLVPRPMLPYKPRPKTDSIVWEFFKELCMLPLKYLEDLCMRPLNYAWSYPDLASFLRAHYLSRVIIQSLVLGVFGAYLRHYPDCPVTFFAEWYAYLSHCTSISMILLMLTSSYEEMMVFCFNYPYDLIWLKDFIFDLYAHKFANPTDPADLVPPTVQHIGLEDVKLTKSTDEQEELRIIKEDKTVNTLLQMIVRVTFIAGTICLITHIITTSL